MTPRLKKNIALSESGFVFDPATGDSFSTNATGLKILEYLKSGIPEEEIVEDMHSMYEAEKKMIREDLDDFINHLKQLKMIVDERS
jgi:hypothetical protein